MAYVVAAFYKFTDLPDVQQKQAELLTRSQNWQIRGTILLATEGINGTIAGSEAAVEQVLQDLQDDDRLAKLEVKRSQADDWPFQHLKIKVKPEIVTFGQPEANPNEQVGTYVAPKDWNVLIQDPDVTLVDTRNDYEVDIGTFQGAQNPQTASFRDFPDYVQENLDPQQHPKVAMFCTGGIRCEKASAYLLKQGFQAVYHLQGGILKYLEEVPAVESLWQGECFVFDDRVTLQHGLKAGTHNLCPNCGYPVHQDAIACPSCEQPMAGQDGNT